MNNCVLIFLYGMSLNGWHAVLCITNNRHDVTITTHAIKRHFLIWMTTVRQPTKRRRPRVLTLKYTFICVYWWTRQRIHNTLIVVDRFLRLMGHKTIPDSAEPRLESFYPPFLAGIDLPHQGVVDSYNLSHGNPHTWKRRSLYWEGPRALGLLHWIKQLSISSLKYKRRHSDNLFVSESPMVTPFITTSDDKDVGHCMSMSMLVYAGHTTLEWRHNGGDGVSNHQPHHCLLNRLFRCRSKKTSKLRVTGLCAGNSPVTSEFSHKGPVTRKCFHLMTSSWVMRALFVVFCCGLVHVVLPIWHRNISPPHGR